MALGYPTQALLLCGFSGMLGIMRAVIRIPLYKGPEHAY
jgi:hypothetical protein